MNNRELLTQAEQFCSYSATHAENENLAAFWNNLGLTFKQANLDYVDGRNSVYRSALITAARFLHADILDVPDMTLTISDEDPE